MASEDFSWGYDRSLLRSEGIVLKYTLAFGAGTVQRRLSWMGFRRKRPLNTSYLLADVRELLSSIYVAKFNGRHWLIWNGRPHRKRCSLSCVRFYEVNKWQRSCFVEPNALALWLLYLTISEAVSTFATSLVPSRLKKTRVSEVVWRTQWAEVPESLVAMGDLGINSESIIPWNKD